jgi:hypothetical protein
MVVKKKQHIIIALFLICFIFYAISLLSNVTSIIDQSDDFIFGV